MKPSDLKTPADVAQWLKYHVEWNDIASTDMMLRAFEILTADGPVAPVCVHGLDPRHCRTCESKCRAYGACRCGPVNNTPQPR